MTSYHVMKLTGRTKSNCVVMYVHAIACLYVTAIVWISVMANTTFSLSISEWNVEGVLKTKGVFMKHVGHLAAMIAIADV